MPCVDFGDRHVPYSRLVSQLYRIWDYEMCEEAQLKVWLAHHLLARENKGEARGSYFGF